MKEFYCNKNFSNYFNLYYLGYDESYCKDRGLFLVKDKAGNIKYITKSFVDYAQEVVNTDYVLVLGTMLVITSKDKKLAEFLNEYIERPSFQNLLERYIMQGLILGDTALRFSLDDEGQPRLDLVRMIDTRISYYKSGFQMKGFNIEYNSYDDEGDLIRVREEYNTRGTKYIADNKEKVVPHEDGISWLIHVPNRPSLYYEVWGETDLEQIYEAIDSINSSFARIDAIEDIYAKPKLIASGLRDFNFRETDNVIAINENAEIQILEYRGQIIPAILDKIKFLETYLKDRMPELLLSHLKELTGYALKLKLIKLIKKIETYRRAYFDGLKKALKLVAIHNGFSNPEFEFVLDEVVPSDEFQNTNKLILLVNSKLISRRTAALKLNIDYDAELEQIKKEEQLDYLPINMAVDNKLKSLSKGMPPTKKDGADENR